MNMNQKYDLYDDNKLAYHELTAREISRIIGSPIHYVYNAYATGFVHKKRWTVRKCFEHKRSFEDLEEIYQTILIYGSTVICESIEEVQEYLKAKGMDFTCEEQIDHKFKYGQIGEKSTVRKGYLITEKRKERKDKFWWER